jgi:hypothetical protein
VETVLDAFALDPDVVLVGSDAMLIGEEGNKIGDSFYAKRGKCRAGLWSNVLIGKFHRCTMAFRSTLMRSVLPFPGGTQIHHDTYIGCVKALIDGKAKYIAKPLVSYRRHSTNINGRTKFRTFKRIRMRCELVLGLLLCWVRRWRRKAY